MKRKRADESPPKKGRAPGLAVTRAQEDRGKSNNFADENKGWQRIIAIRHLRNIEALLRQLVAQSHFNIGGNDDAHWN
jgi:hypothetical protein